MGNYLKVSYSVDNLKDIRSFVTKRLQELSIPELEINMIVLAVDEVCANMIIHANPAEKDQHLEVRIKDDQEGVSFEIKDNGEPFDPNTYEVPEINDIIKTKRKGGLGLMLVKRIMDKIEYKRENDQTFLHLFKKVNFVNHSA